jgi:diguanylate cyclase (GGDEF)-like protein
MTPGMAPIGPASGHDHLVEFYETEAFLTVTVCGFLAPALRAGDAAVVVATSAHRRAFAGALTEDGIDVVTAVGEGRLVVLDASETLERFMVGGRPDSERFRDTFTEILDRASLRGERQVRIYGEMVALLWERGDADSTIALGDLWNDLAKIRRFLLLRAYPMRAFDDEASGAAFKRICEQHQLVIPGESYSLLTDAAERASAVAQLQQQRAALQAEVLRLRAEREAFAELAYVDTLTGFANRRSFGLHLEREWALTLRDDIDSYVVMAQLDGAGAPGASGDAQLGDDVLLAFADALRSASRRSDIIARVSAGSFAVLLLRCDDRAAPAFMARLRETIAERSWPVPGQISVRMGPSSLQESMSAAVALDRAELAMHASAPG